MGKRKRRGMSTLLHYRGQDINQTNYGATTVSNPWRGNEMIGGRLKHNQEPVNENINYLMIYWESGLPPTLYSPPPLSNPPPQRAFVLIE